MPTDKVLLGIHSAPEEIKQMQIKTKIYVLHLMLAKVKNGKNHNSNVKDKFIHPKEFIECQYVLGSAEDTWEMRTGAFLTRTHGCGSFWNPVSGTSTVDNLALRKSPLGNVL